MAIPRFGIIALLIAISSIASPETGDDVAIPETLAHDEDLVQAGWSGVKTDKHPAEVPGRLTEAKVMKYYDYQDGKAAFTKPGRYYGNKHQDGSTHKRWQYKWGTLQGAIGCNVVGYKEPNFKGRVWAAQMNNANPGSTRGWPQEGMCYETYRSKPVKCVNCEHKYYGDIRSVLVSPACEKVVLYDDGGVHKFENTDNLEVVPPGVKNIGAATKSQPGGREDELYDDIKKIDIWSQVSCYSKKQNVKKASRIREEIVNKGSRESTKKVEAREQVQKNPAVIKEKKRKKRAKREKRGKESAVKSSDKEKNQKGDDREKNKKANDPWRIKKERETKYHEGVNKNQYKGPAGSIQHYKNLMDAEKRKLDRAKESKGKYDREKAQEDENKNGWKRQKNYTTCDGVKTYNPGADCSMQRHRRRRSIEVLAEEEEEHEPILASELHKRAF